MADHHRSVQQPVTEAGPSDRRIRSRVVRVFGRHRYLTLLTLGFMIGGVVFARACFPELSALRATLGGVVFGAFCTLCVVCHSVIWQSGPVDGPHTGG